MPTSAALLGIDADEVRTRARGALTELGGADPDAQVGLTDYLLGQADPIGRADVARHLQSDPEPPRSPPSWRRSCDCSPRAPSSPNLPGSGGGGLPRPRPAPPRRARRGAATDAAPRPAASAASAAVARSAPATSACRWSSLAAGDA